MERTTNVRSNFYSDLFAIKHRIIIQRKDTCNARNNEIIHSVKHKFLIFIRITSPFSSNHRIRIRVAAIIIFRMSI